jgi:hypothetical protein
VETHGGAGNPVNHGSSGIALIPAINFPFQCFPWIEGCVSGSTDCRPVRGFAEQTNGFLRKIPLCVDAVADLVVLLTKRRSQ